MRKQNYNVNEYANFSINEVNSMYQNKQLDISLEKIQIPSKNQSIYTLYFRKTYIKVRGITRNN